MRTRLKEMPLDRPSGAGFPCVGVGMAAVMSFYTSREVTQHGRSVGSKQQNPHVGRQRACVVAHCHSTPQPLPPHTNANLTTEVYQAAQGAWHSLSFARCQLSFRMLSGREFIPGHT